MTQRPAQAPTLPPLAALSAPTAHLERHITPLGRLRRRLFFPREDGRAETEHVFLGANRLPERFAAWQASRAFVIGETGFGTGLNMLCAWACFEQHAPADARLHLLSTEKISVEPRSIDARAQRLALVGELFTGAMCPLARRGQRYSPLTFKRACHPRSSLWRHHRTAQPAGRSSGCLVSRWLCTVEKPGHVATSTLRGHGRSVSPGGRRSLPLPARASSSAA